MVERLRGARFHRQPEDYREHLFREIRAVVQERFGPGVWTSMAPMQRVVVELLLADRLDDVVALAQWEAGVGSRAHLTDLRWQDGSLGLALTAELAVRGQPVTFRRHGEQALLEPPLSPQARALIPPEHLETTTHLRKTKVDVVLRSRQSGAEHYVPATFDLGEQELGPDPGVFSVQLHAEARIDPSNVAGGSPLTSGVWEVLARVNSCGWSKESRVGSVRFPEISRPVYPAMVDGDPLAVTPHLDGQGHLSLDIASAPPSRGRKEVRRSPWRARFRPRSEHRLLR